MTTLQKVGIGCGGCLTLPFAIIIFAAVFNAVVPDSYIPEATPTPIPPATPQPKAPVIAPPVSIPEPEPTENSFYSDAKAIAKHSRWSVDKVEEELGACASAYSQRFEEVSSATLMVDDALRSQGIKQDMVPVLQDLRKAITKIPAELNAFQNTIVEYGHAREQKMSHREAIKFAIKDLNL